MDEESFAKFLELSGHRVIKTASGWWYNYLPQFYMGVPLHRPRKVDPEEIKFLHWHISRLGIVFSCTDEPNAEGKLMLCKDKPYDFSSLSTKARNQTRRGLERCQVEQISFERLAREGLAINQSALKRQRREGSSSYTDLQLWERTIKAWSSFEDITAWGAFMEGNLAAYVITMMVDNYCLITNFMSHSSYLSHYPNNALIFTVTKTVLSRPEIDYVTLGLESTDPYLVHFKENMGFKRQPLKLRVELNPILKPILSPTLRFLLPRAKNIKML